MNAYAKFPAADVADAAQWALKYNPNNSFAQQRDFLNDLLNMANHLKNYGGTDATINLDIKAYKLISQNL